MPAAPTPTGYAGVALWTLDPAAPWCGCLDDPVFADVFDALKVRIAQGWALDATFSPFIQAHHQHGMVLFGNFLGLSAVFRVAVPDDRLAEVRAWSQAYRAGTLHQQARRIAALAAEIVAIRTACVGPWHMRASTAIARTSQQRAELRDLDAAMAVTSTPDMNRPLPPFTETPRTSHA